MNDARNVTRKTTNDDKSLFQQYFERKKPEKSSLCEKITFPKGTCSQICRATLHLSRIGNQLNPQNRAKKERHIYQLSMGPWSKKLSLLEFNVRKEYILLDELGITPLAAENLVYYTFLQALCKGISLSVKIGSNATAEKPLLLNTKPQNPFDLICQKSFKILAQNRFC